MPNRHKVLNGRLAALSSTRLPTIIRARSRRVRLVAQVAARFVFHVENCCKYG
ncbi:MAG TPA: hypothetical protein VM821_07735 [Abditibacteriaceae bacterium]|nr:hypothetical protein [Abditibacteriaceae bacterium]